MKTNLKVKYFNFPIQLLEGFLGDSSTCLNNICDYAVYVRSLKLEFGDDNLSRFRTAANFYNLKFYSIEERYLNGKLLFDSIDLNSPKTGLNITIYKDFVNSNKNEFEKVSLLGYLALKSIIGFKSYCKVTNNYWLSRMDGKRETVKNKRELSEQLQKYSSEYQTKKIKKELHLNWSLKDYGRHVRGFYVSFKLNMEQLVFEAEKRRVINREKLYKEQQKIALEVALKKLSK